MDSDMPKERPVPQFHFRQTGDDPDHLGDGIELPDLDAARAEAVRFLAETIRFRPDHVWNGQDFRVEVTDRHGMILCTVLVLGVDSPAAQCARPA